MNEPLVIWNGKAGASASALEIRQQLAESGGCLIAETERPEEVGERIQEAIEKGCPRIIAAGGDGTVNLVLQAVAAANDPLVEMAILPLGTGNDLARTLGMSLTPEEAVLQVLGGEVFEADVLRCTWDGGSRIVANMCTAGNTGVYLTQLTPEMKQRWGPYCYIRGVIDVLRDLQAFDVRVEWPDEPVQSLSILNIFAANGRTTGGGMEIAPDAQLDDGLIDVVLIADGAVGEIASLTANYLLSDFRKHPLVTYRQVSKFRLEAEVPLPVTIDGDVVTDGPIRLEVEAQKVRLVRPAATSK